MFMKVKLIDYQNNALELLIYTKSTRLQADQSLDDINNWTYEKKMEHLEYMRNTIASSWEFVNYIFELTDVSRVFTHQLVRSRHQSYAQQSQRTVDVSEMGFYSIGNSAADCAMDDMSALYIRLQEAGVSNQDARYVLPEGTLTNIIVGTNLRVLSETAEVRLCKRTAGEYQEVFKAMKSAVVNVHPWVDKFIQVACVKTGICIFPNYTECPVQEYTVKISDVKKLEISYHWRNLDHVANPVAKEGKTM